MSQGIHFKAQGQGCTSLSDKKVEGLMGNSVEGRQFYFVVHIEITLSQVTYPETIHTERNIRFENYDLIID
jgi:hypothetical protein